MLECHLICLKSDQHEHNRMVITTEQAGLKETILHPDEYFASLMIDIDEARHTIDLETYIYENDKVGSQIAEKLIAAARRKVKVRLLIDGLGISEWSDDFKKMEAAGVQIRIYHPLPWKLWQWQQTHFKSTFFNKLIYLFSHLNSRNHRKTCIIDRDIVYVGSANITKKHLNKKSGGEGWKDLAVRVTGANIQELQLSFDYIWQQHPILDANTKKIYKSKEQQPSFFRLNFTLWRRRALYKSLLKRLREAQKRVWITSAYFNPDYFLLKALLQAAKHGVDVKIILPSKTDVMIMPYVYTSFYEDMLKNNIKVYEYQPSILHSKLIIIDNWFCVGSSNFNNRSLFHDLEVDVCVQTQDAKDNMEEEFRQNLSQSKQILLSDVKKQSIFKRMISRIVLLARYFL